MPRPDPRKPKPPEPLNTTSPSFGISDVEVNGVSVPFEDPPLGQPIRIIAPAFSTITFWGDAIPEEGASQIEVVQWFVNNGNWENAEQVSPETQLEWRWMVPHRPLDDDGKPIGTKGTYRIGAAGIYSFGFRCEDNRGAEAGASATVEARPAFNLTIERPQDNQPIHDTSFDLQVSAASPSSPVQSISWRLEKDGTSHRNGNATQRPDGTWSDRISLPPPSPSVPKDGISYKLVVTGRNQFETATAMRDVTAIDGTPPTLQIEAPSDGSEIPGTLNGGTLDLIVEASDTDNPAKLHSGVDRVEWSLVEPVPPGWPHPASGRATYQPSDDTWRAAITLPPRNWRTISMRCYDKQGNRSIDHRTRVVVAIPFEVEDLSPPSYLKDLLAFVTVRLKQADEVNYVDPKLLADTFYQPFDRLIVADKDVVNQPVHRIRLCIEVLRRYLRNETTSAAAESGYRQAAYQTLLNNLGTSYEEIRLARAAAGDEDEEARKELADRLGIVLTTPRPDQLDGLFLSLEQLTEADLERLFGLVNTDRDPLSEGAKLGDQQGQILRWNLDGVEWNKNTDPEGTIYVQLRKPTTNVFRVELFRDRGRTALVASGERNTAQGTVELSQENGSGLSGHFDIRYVGDTDDIEVSAVPNLLSWHMEHLRALWRKQDWSNDAPPGAGDGLFATYFDNRDLTGPTVTRIDPEIAFNWGDGSPDPAIGADDFSVSWTGKVLASYSEPYTFYTQTDDGVKLWVDNQLLIDEWHPNNNQPYEKTINLQAGRLYDIRMDYFEQGGNANATLSWSSPSTPKKVIPKSHLFSGQNDNLLPDWLPIIDPDLIGSDDLKDPRAGNPAYDLWKERRDWVVAQLDEVKRQRESNTPEEPPPTGEPPLLRGFNHIVGKILPQMDLVALDEERKGGSGIEGKLRENQLSIQAFNYLVRIRKLAAIDRDGDSVLPSEWNDVYSILVQVLKLRVYDFGPYKDPWSGQTRESWRKEEERKNLSLGPDYFKIPEADASNVSPPPPKLPAWRATSRAREKWQRTLRARIEQQQGVVQALQEVVDATEEATLPLLRDALVSAIGQGRTGIDVAEALTQRLLIDVKSSGYPKTTRVEQAAETLQSILFSFRAEHFSDKGAKLGPNPAAGWKLDDEQPGYGQGEFDQEFKWMGSYDTWRAAVSAFYYPENILLPRMRREQAPAPAVPHPHPRTPEFSTHLIANLRGQRGLTPEKAREAAREYLKQVKDGQPPKIKVPAGTEVQLTDQLSETQLAGRRNLVQALVNENASDDEQDKIDEQAKMYLEEIFYFVPLHLALQLQQAGHYLTALDWLQTVYAYNLPADTGQRKIYGPLNLDPTVTLPVRRTVEWLLHYLDPHRVAASRKDAYTRFALISLARCFLEYADAEFVHDTDESLPKARALYTNALDVLDSPEMAQTGGTASSSAAFPPNPLLRSLRRRAELNLFKLRTGRNFAGMRRQIEPVVQDAKTANGSPIFGGDGQLVVPGQRSFQPTPYYYSVLIERAKQLIGICQQVEAAYLHALERTDAENYSLLEAGHALDLAKANVDLQDLRVIEARDGEELANRQKSRAEEQATTYGRWIAAGTNWHEEAMLQSHRDANLYRNWAASMDAVITVAGAWGSFSVDKPGTWIAPGIISAAATARAATTIAANNAERRAQEHSFRASHERRVEEWKLQKSIAEKDVSISLQQIQLAKDHLAVTQQEGRIAQMQSDHAKAVADFLANKFMNAELYEWMTGVLAQVYGHFLRQTTAVAQLAQNQLAFERQEVPPSFIQADYWQPTSDNGTSVAANGEPDRRGLTGSARLLQDIYQLDQYAFETNERKLQLRHTISLAQTAPLEFQRFRETGTLPFATPMEMFDRLFPGHYLRLIRQVRTSVVALVPPTHGIRATLSASGVSRVVTGGDVFRTTVVRRDPELVALSSPMNATGLFELDPQSEMLRPFEAMGVETSWEFQMPKAANPFDYRTIADVLMTIEYTALNSFDYRQQVIQGLNRTFGADRPFSLRRQFPDQWYDLHNSDQATPPAMTVHFETVREDFPPNIENLKIDHLILYLAFADGKEPPADLPVSLRFTEQGRTHPNPPGPPGGEKRSSDGVFSTRRGAPGAWGGMQSLLPVGKWELTLPNTEEMKNLFKREKIEDILFVITYSGRTPEWPAYVA